MASAHQIRIVLHDRAARDAWPAAASRSAMARPLVSVASVRVSLTVTMKHCTDRGACALCSASAGIRVIVARRACYDPPHARQRNHRDADVAKRMRVRFVPCRLSSRSRSSSAAPSRSVQARPRRRALGRRHAQEADARREGRAAHRPVVRVRLPQHRQRHVRRAGAAGHATSTSAAFTCSGQSQPAPPVLLNPAYGTVILGQPLSAAFLINRLQAPGDGAAAEHGRLRDRRRLPDLRRHVVSASDGDGRRQRRRLARARGGAHHRRSKRARSACTSISRRSPTSTTTRATRSSTRDRTARIPRASARWSARTSTARARAA